MQYKYNTNVGLQIYMLEAHKYDRNLMFTM